MYRYGGARIHKISSMAVRELSAVAYKKAHKVANNYESIFSTLSSFALALQSSIYTDLRNVAIIKSQIVS